MKALLITLLILCLLVWLSRPYSADVARYVIWRITDGHAFLKGTVDSGDATIGFQTIGPTVRSSLHAVPLVLLHGGFGTDLDWYAQIPALSKKIELVLIDTRGHGRSTLGNSPLSYELLASDVVSVLNSLELDEVDIVGWSDGGNTGLLLALHHHKRVRRLIAISANARPEGLLPKVLDKIEQANHGGSVLTRLLRKWLTPEPEDWRLFAKGVTKLWRNYPQLSNNDLASISIPVLIIAGSKDDVSQSHLDEMASTIPSARLVVLPDIGHFVPQSAPNKVRQLINDFLGITT